MTPARLDVTPTRAVTGVTLAQWPTSTLSAPSYVQQTQVPGGCRTTPKTEDRTIATARYKVFAHEKGTRLIERTERVLVEGLPRKGKR
jgi:hypothetical protein